MNPFSNLLSLNDILIEDDSPFQPNFRLNENNLNQNSPYIMLDKANEFHNKTGHFSVVNVNARSLSKNYNELTALLKKTKADCLIVTETWLTIHNTEFWNFKGYKSYHHPRLHATHGGVSIFVKDHIQSEDLPLLSVTNEIIECKGVAVQLVNYKLNILGIYTSPQSNRQMFLDSLENILTRIGNTGDTILAGDFNINLLKLKEDRCSLRLYNTLIS